MIVDTSALIAILRDESDAPYFAEALASAQRLRISAANYLEAAIVIDTNGGPTASRCFDELINVAGISIEPVTEEQARIAREAYRLYGKGSGHPAQLNFGDCFAYTLATVCEEGLLYKGNDFSHIVIASIKS